MNGLVQEEPNFNFGGEIGGLIYLTKNITMSAMGPHLVDFINVIGLPSLIRQEVNIDKRESPYSPDKLSQLLIIQNMLGYDRIEGSRALNQDEILKQKLNIDNYPDSETFRDELKKYTPENIEELFMVNQGLGLTIIKVRNT